MNQLNNYNSTNCTFEHNTLDDEINNYDKFSSVYDEIIGNDVAEILAMAYKPILSELMPEELKDIGCGSGAFMRAVSRYLPDTKFYGMDRSKGQIERARSLSGKFKNIQYEQFRIDHVKPHIENYLIQLSYSDVTTMNLDVLNHIESRYWQTLFSNIRRYLFRGGIFLFDMNTQKRILEDWNYPEVIIKQDMTYVQVGSGAIEEKDGFITRRLYMQLFTHGNTIKGDTIKQERKRSFWRKMPTELPTDICVPSRRYVVQVEQTAPTNQKLFQMLKEAYFSKIEMNSIESDHLFMKNRLFVQATK